MHADPAPHLGINTPGRMPGNGGEVDIVGVDQAYQHARVAGKGCMDGRVRQQLAIDPACGAQSLSESKQGGGLACEPCTCLQD